LLIGQGQRDIAIVILCC